MATSTFRGEDYAVFTGGVAGAAKTRPGYLQKIVVTVAVVGALTVHDNASAASGTVLYTTSAPAAGTVVDLGIRAKAGLFVTPGTSGTVLVAFD